MIIEQQYKGEWSGQGRAGQGRAGLNSLIGSIWVPLPR